jgi:hypothetical protein
MTKQDKASAWLLIGGAILGALVFGGISSVIGIISGGYIGAFFSILIGAIYGGCVGWTAVLVLLFSRIMRPPKKKEQK